MHYTKRELWILLKRLELDIHNYSRWNRFYTFIKKLYNKNKEGRHATTPLNVPSDYRLYFEIPFEDIPLYITRDELPSPILIFLKWRLEIGK